MEKQEVMLEIRVDAEGALNFKLNELDETEVALTVDDTKTQKRPSGRSNDTCYVLLLGNTGSKREFIDVILQEPRFSESFGKLNTRSTVNCILSPPQQESQGSELKLHLINPPSFDGMTVTQCLESIQDVKNNVLKEYFPNMVLIMESATSISVLEEHSAFFENLKAIRGVPGIFDPDDHNVVVVIDECLSLMSDASEELDTKLLLEKENAINDVLKSTLGISAPVVWLDELRQVFRYKIHLPSLPVDNLSMPTSFIFVLKDLMMENNDEAGWNAIKKFLIGPDIDDLEGEIYCTGRDYDAPAETSTTAANTIKAREFETTSTYYEEEFSFECLDSDPLQANALPDALPGGTDDMTTVEVVITDTYNEEGFSLECLDSDQLQAKALPDALPGGINDMKALEFALTEETDEPSVIDLWFAAHLKENERKLTQNQKDDAEKIRKALRQMKITERSQLEGQTLKSLSNLLRIKAPEDTISLFICNMLEQLLHLNIPTEAKVDILVGSGYNRFNKNVQDIFETPGIIKYSMVERTTTYKKHDEDLMSVSRGGQVGWNADLTISDGLVQAGGSSSFSKAKTDKTASTNQIFVYERQLFKQVAQNLKAWKPLAEFKREVENLPNTFDQHSPANVTAWEYFFSLFGHDVIVSVTFGGFLTFKMTADSDTHDKNKTGEMAINPVDFWDFFKSGAHAGASSEGNQVKKHSVCAMNYTGGNSAYHVTSSSATLEEVKSWLESLNTKPAPLDHTMSLVPIDRVVQIVGATRDGAAEARAMDAGIAETGASRVGTTKALACRDALGYFFPPKKTEAVKSPWWHLRLGGKMKERKLKA